MRRILLAVAPLLGVRFIQRKKMNVMQKAVFTASSSVKSAGVPPVARGAGLAYIDPALGAATSVSYSLADKALLQVHLQTAGARIGFDYDVRAMDGSDLPTRGVIQLTSKNFGYDFALVQVDNGRGMFGLRKKIIRMYASPGNTKDYAFIGEARSLSRALRRIDTMYREAANAHLA